MTMLTNAIVLVASETKNQASAFVYAGLAIRLIRNTSNVAALLSTPQTVLMANFVSYAWPSHPIASDATASSVTNGTDVHQSCTLIARANVRAPINTSKIAGTYGSCPKLPQFVFHNENA